MIITGDTKELHALFYNLETIAPGKGEAKKTVSEGLIYLRKEVTEEGVFIEGMASDDILSIHGELWLPEPRKQADLEAGVCTVEALKSARGTLTKGKGVQSVAIPTQAVKPDWEDTFWLVHIFDSINSEVPRIAKSWWFINPDRIGKLRLLEPRGQYPLRLDHVEWSDRDIFRWSYGSYKGVYTYPDLNYDGKPHETNS